MTFEVESRVTGIVGDCTCITTLVNQVALHTAASHVSLVALWEVALVRLDFNTDLLVIMEYREIFGLVVGGVSQRVPYQ